MKGPWLIHILETAWEHVVTAPTPAMSVVVLMVSFLLCLFLLRLIIRRHRIRIARMKIPFVVGGWGTRGKSGTERKKAALFEGLGYHVLSKTTGCEAMIIHARPGQDAVELPLYRPGDKATIWEQGKVVHWAGRFRSQVLLWECMALGSDYAGTLQHDWMNDTLSTLSNTFVDHENIQGPTGMDVARSLTAFIPYHSTLFTAEDNMQPLIAEICRERNTELHDLAWYESDLIGDDVLEQFPYTVHPRNLGMVLKMARHLAIDETVALREIARNIIPDLGSFKCYQTRFRSRYLEFWNGFSANDRMSAVENWQKAGFYDVRDSAQTWCIGIINNRDDRIIRSREFSEVIVNDTPARLHVLIGTNLSGLHGYLQDAVRQFAARHSLISESRTASKNPADFSALRDRTLKTLRRTGAEAMDMDIIHAKTARMTGMDIHDTTLRQFIGDLETLETPDVHSIVSLMTEYEIESEYRDDIAHQLLRDLMDCRKIQDFLSYLKNELESENNVLMVGSINEKFRQLLTEVFMNRFHMISNPFLSGDQILTRICRLLPPNTKIKMMGMQNIKGTGLDFAYRWVSLDKVKSAVNTLHAENPESRRKALDFLLEYDDYGIMDSPVAIDGLKEYRKQIVRDNPDLIAQLDDAVSRIQRHLVAHRDALKSQSGYRGWKKTFFWMIEQLREAGDSKRRKRMFNRVMNDLFHQRISHIQAKKVLHEIKKRQEGGWMLQ
ncbi:MAG TPA: hypothetical protein PLV45_08545 [bacterium]|nr:hypothetical protein [bacterium]